MPARACATTRSAAAICSSRTRSSGSSAFSRASQPATATSLSCSASNASRSGCTLPPCMLEDFPGGTFSVSFICQSSFLQSQPKFVWFGCKIDFALNSPDFPRLSIGFDLGQCPYEEIIGGINSGAGALQLLKCPGGHSVQSIRAVLGKSIEHTAVNLRSEVFPIDLCQDPCFPVPATQHDPQNRLLNG